MWWVKHNNFTRIEQVAFFPAINIEYIFPACRALSWAHEWLIQQPVKNMAVCINVFPKQEKRTARNYHYWPSRRSGLRFASRHFTTCLGCDRNFVTSGLTSLTETHSELPKSTWNTRTSQRADTGPFFSSTVWRELVTRPRYHLPSSLNRAQQYSPTLGW